MHSKRSHEGVVWIDHSNSPGVPDEIMVAAGYPVGAGHHKFESATFTCSHCEAVVVMNPDRSRARGYCRKCDHYVCDACEATRVSTGICRTMKQIADEILNQNAKVIRSSEAFTSPIIIP